MKSKSLRRIESRRQEARRIRGEQRSIKLRNLASRFSAGAVGIWLLFCVAAMLVILLGSETMPYRLNQRVDRDINARVAFEIRDAVRTRQEREIARASAPWVYQANPAPLLAIRGELTELLTLAKTSPQATETLKTAAKSQNWQLDEAAVAQLLAYAADETANRDFDARVNHLIESLRTEYIVEKPVDLAREELPPTTILRNTDGTDQAEIPTSQLQYINDAKNISELVEQDVLEAFGETNPLVVPIATQTLRILLGPTSTQTAAPVPLWRFDPTATDAVMEAAVQKVQEYTIPRKTGDLLVKAGTRLDPRDMDLLSQEHQAYLQATKVNPDMRHRSRMGQLGLASLSLILSVGMGLYMAVYQESVLKKAGQILVLASILFGLLFLNRLALLTSRSNEQLAFLGDWPIEFATGFVVMAAAMITIAYNQRFAFGLTSAFSVLVTLASRGDLSLFLTLLAATTTTVLSLREVRTRSKVVAVGTLAGAMAFITSMACGLMSEQEFKFVLSHALAAGGASLAAGFIVQGILPNFEKVFGIATSMTLLEWCDASQPLLRRLAQETPGTYSHSLVLSQMANEAADAIGANGLLTRVGALYHDIGKTQKSPYFVENQQAQINRHDRLSPTMSLLVIVGHVKDGLELARAYGMPRVLHSFISEHHGTTVVKYFHHVASEAAAKNRIRGKHDRQVPDTEFRYPGPKPSTRESAVLMVCDSCEGAVRALSEATPGRIESTVHQMVMDRLNDGQFDNCDITLRELRMVEQSAVKSLTAIHHGRIKYPKIVSEVRPTQPTNPEVPAPMETGTVSVSAEPVSPTAEVARPA